jgi:hypothetical protein
LSDAIANVRTPLIRVLIGLFYAVPAGTVGYQASLELAEIAVPSEGWREAFASSRSSRRRHCLRTHEAVCPAADWAALAERAASPSLAGASRDG